MKFNLSQMSYSNKDIIKNIRIPLKLNRDLANLIGIHLGDGNLTYNKNKKDNYVSYTGDLTEEYDWHINYLGPLLNRLFNIKCSIYIDKRSNNTSIKTYFRSKVIARFLEKILFLPLDNKSNCQIPQLILEGSKNIKAEFLKGFADTDFSLTFKKRNKLKHYYPVINFSTPNRKLVEQLYQLLIQFNLKPFIGLDYKTKRNGKNLITNQIDLNGTKNLAIWMKNIGFSSSKHLTKYKIWNKYGFCPSKTTLGQRKQIIMGKLNVNSFY